MSRSLPPLLTSVRACVRGKLQSSLFFRGRRREKSRGAHSGQLELRILFSQSLSLSLVLTHARKRRRNFLLSNWPPPLFLPWLAVMLPWGLQDLFPINSSLVDDPCKEEEEEEEALRPTKVLATISFLPPLYEYVHTMRTDRETGTPYTRRGLDHFLFS